MALQLCNPSDCQITYLDEYYLTNYEIELLKKSAAEMASKIPEGAIVVELGSGLVSTFFFLQLCLRIPAWCLLVLLVLTWLFAPDNRNLRKVCLLLQAFEDAKKKIDYFALDLSQTELERTLAEAPEFEYVSCRGLRGTYDDGCEWLKQEAMLSRPKCILHLGSSIGMKIFQFS